MQSATIPSYVKRVLDLLEGVNPTSRGWIAYCPCPTHGENGDQHPSLAVAIGNAGRILLHCPVGCKFDAILAAIHLEARHLLKPLESLSDPESSSEPVETSGTRPPADLDLCHRAYTLLLGHLALGDEHHKDLLRRGLSDPEIIRREYRTLQNADRDTPAAAVFKELGEDMEHVPGFIRQDKSVTLAGKLPGLLIPVRAIGGRIQALKIRTEYDPKYIYLTSSTTGGPSPGSPLHVPLGTPTSTPIVRVTEGEIKADVCAALDPTPTIGVPGVCQWEKSLAILKELKAKTVVIAFDAPDVCAKPPVFNQAKQFCEALRAAAFEVELEIWNASQGH